MIRDAWFDIRKILLTILLFSGIAISLYSQGTSVQGVINEYTDVVAIGIDNVTVSNADRFNPGDYVLIIQMKGAIIEGSNTSNYGAYLYSAGSPGSYEFLIVRSVNHLTQNVVFTTGSLANSYDVAGLVQLIRVPYYDAATVTGDLTCQAWNSSLKTGGVLAIFVGGNLLLNANIDVSGKGFSGGTPASGNGICTSVAPATYDRYSYPATDQNSGFKGEGLATRVYIGVGNEVAILPGYAKGRGINFTGGGGGNGGYAGGGGGSGTAGITDRFGYGGDGGVESEACGPGNQFGNGKGGTSLFSTGLEGGLILGSGGGSSTFGAGGNATPGGNGGGIIIIICDTLKGSGKIINANGSSAAGRASGNAGAGGGGGGGTVALYLQSLSSRSSESALTISANGGNGGNTNNKYGEGGGGGGGMILTNSGLPFPANVALIHNGGTAGTRIGGSLGGTTSGGGENNTEFMPVLTGFLFNNVRSSVTNNDVDSVCSNMTPPKIIGTKPVGGSGVYTYLWQKSYEPAFTSPVAPENIATLSDYTPLPGDAITPTGTVWFRRIVYDTGPPAITDISKPARIIIHPAISNNHIGNPDRFCVTGDPATITQLLPDLVVPSMQSLYYTWQDSSSSRTWTNIGTSREYDPPAGLVRTTRYRRIVTSGSCVDISPAVEMTVLPLITGNSIYRPAEDSICSGSVFQTIKGSKATLLAGGDNTYLFKWERSYNNSPWATFEGVYDRDSLNPISLAERVPDNYYRFRRIVYSGLDSVCSDISDTVELRDFAHISNNTIFTSVQPICSGSVPTLISGNLPNNGNSRYTWQERLNSGTVWTDIAGYVNIDKRDYQPPVLTASTNYRRIAHSYGSGCSNISDSVLIVVLPPIVNNMITLSIPGQGTICHGQVPPAMLGTENSSGGAGAPYTYQWLDSIALRAVWSEINGATGVNYLNSPSLNVTTYYKRLVTDRQSVCSDTSTTMITVNVLPPISNNFITETETTICENTAPDPITGSPPAGGSGFYSYHWRQSTDGGTSWIVAEGVNNLNTYQPPVLSSIISYRRGVISAMCDTVYSNPIDFMINPEPDSPVNAGPDQSIKSIDATYIMKAEAAVVPGESGYWAAPDPSLTIDDVSDSKSTVRNLSPDKNLFVWTITNSLCEIHDSVYILLLPYIIPQGFSPNGDGWNNKFVIEGLNLTDKQIAELTILNGAGVVVFTTTNRDGKQWVDWDGTNTKGAELPNGTYYYMLQVSTSIGIMKESGFIELKRN